MHLKFRNVNEAFQQLVMGFTKNTIPTVIRQSRVGQVLTVEEPVIVTYEKPLERVLFNRARDCNPFFHMFEALWMLAGRDDVAPLAYYNPKMQEFSDDGKTLHGAYGYRWRKLMEFDQLEELASHLQEEPGSRREVLQIWDEVDLVTDGKDIPCNTHVYFAVRKEPLLPAKDGSHVNDPPEFWKRYLDMTVCNRSNDLIWGMLGANVVHFSFLQEYMAACIGVEVGQYHQFTNNLHVYTERWEPNKWLDAVPGYDYRVGNCRHVPLVKHPKQFDRECKAFVDRIDGGFKEPFIRDVAQPMCAAFRAHKRRNYRDDTNALRIMEHVKADDWRIAGIAWIEKRMKVWEDKSRAKTSP